MNTSIVALSTAPSSYLNIAPFNPSERYPEYPFPTETCLSTTPNPAYAAVRRAFELLGLDRSRIGSSGWNPLRDIIRPGASVVLKPNWVFHSLPNDERPEEILITHPSVIRAVLDYVFLACGPQGTVTLGDAPIQSADFERIVEMSQIRSVLELYATYHNFHVKLVDFRRYSSIVTPSGRVVQQKTESADPKGYRIVDIAEDSWMEEISQHWRKFRCLDYDPKALQDNHHPGTHKYLVSGSVLDADVFVNLPKLKTHGKCGITCSLKNLVGINGDKAYLPHFRTGSPADNGDDYAVPSVLKRFQSEVRGRLVVSEREMMWRLTRWAGRSALDVARRLRPREAVGGANPYDISAGHWFGNDTAWRMVLDLNSLLFFVNTMGEIDSHRQRQYISVVDGIIAGEGNGPLEPTRRPAGKVLAGMSPVAVDLVAAHIMGFDWRKLNLLRAAREKLGPWFPDRDVGPISVCSDAGHTDLEKLDVNLNFRAPDGWIGNIERKDI